MESTDHTERLANNLRYLRHQFGLTQARLASLCGVPRSTIANLETGSGNPTLAVIARLSMALHVSIEELLSTPRAQGRVYPAGSLPARRRRGATVQRLLPDPIPGMEIDRMEIEPGGTFRGVPHRSGTREYLCCEEGTIAVQAAGERLVLHAGDVATFQGDQPHSYSNVGEGTAIGFSVVTLAPVAPG